jgi:hypothetical protein
MFELRMFAIHGWKVVVYSSVIWYLIVTDGLEMIAPVQIQISLRFQC